MADDGRAEDDDDGAEPARGEAWLTYRYRLGGGTAETSGTIKAPSFSSAARWIVRRRLAGHLGATPAYLRLRAAGEEEVLYRVTPPGEGQGGGPRLEVVPRDSHRFGPTGGDADSDTGTTQ